jgi:DNA-binding response OmpR family regulator
MTVLVVDQEPGIRHLLDRALQSLGMNVILARNSVDAVVLFQVFRVGIVLLDVDLPRPDGPETLRRLHAIRPVACVFMDGGTSYTKQELLDIGACDVIRKPFGSFEVLVETLKACFEKEEIKNAM